MARSDNKGPRIIALTGPKTCGKDTAAAGLLKQNNMVTGQYTPLFKRTPFATGVKIICHNVFGWSFEQMDDPVFKETPLLEWPCCEPRWPMMDIANFMRDRYGPDVWVRTLDKHIKEIHARDPHGAYIITDLRFPNELDWLDTQNALVVYVLRAEAEQKLAAAQEAGDPKALNPSEIHYIEMNARADKVLYNEGSIYDVQHQLMNIVRERFDHWMYWGGKPREGIDVV